MQSTFTLLRELMLLAAVFSAVALVVWHMPEQRHAGTAASTFEISDDRPVAVR